MNNYLTHLSDLGIIEITGSDAPEFLQGQFTCDISDIKNHQSRFSAWCNAQGRVICSFLILRDNDRYLLMLPEVLIATVSTRLKVFVLRAKVGLTTRSRQYFCTGISGYDANDIADRLNNTGSQREPVLQAAVSPFETGRTILLIPSDTLDSYHSRLASAGLQLSDHQAWKIADIEAGIAWIYPQTNGELMPQELNLERIGGLSYNKGCYPGQEIIARLHFRGRQKRRLCYGYLESSYAEMQIGAKLHAGAESSIVAGIIINSVRESRDMVRILAVIDIDQAGTNTVVTENGQPLHFTPFPYQTDIS